MPDSWIDKEEFDELLGAFSPKKRKNQHHGADRSLKRAREALDRVAESAGAESGEAESVADVDPLVESAEAELKTEKSIEFTHDISEAEVPPALPLEGVLEPDVPESLPEFDKIEPEVLRHGSVAEAVSLSQDPAETETEEGGEVERGLSDASEIASSGVGVAESTEPELDRPEETAAESEGAISLDISNLDRPDSAEVPPPVDDSDQREIERDMFGELMFSCNNTDENLSDMAAQDDPDGTNLEKAGEDTIEFKESSIPGLEISSRLLAGLKQGDSGETGSSKADEGEISSIVNRRSSSEIIVKVEPLRKSDTERIPQFLDDAHVLDLEKEKSSREHDAAIALKALAEARSLAEDNDLIRVSKFPESVEPSQPDAEKEPRRISEPEIEEDSYFSEIDETILDPVSIGTIETSLELLPAEHSSQDGLEETEESFENKEENPSAPEATEPLASPELSEPPPVTKEPKNYDDWPDFENSPELEFHPRGALSQRVKSFTDLAYENLEASDVIVFDLDGYCLNEPQRKDRRAKGASAGSLFNSVATVPYTVGFRGHTATQVCDAEGKWNCLIPGWGDARRIVARFELDHPLEKGAVRAWSKALAEVLESNHDEGS